MRGAASGLAALLLVPAPLVVEAGEARPSYQFLRAEEDWTSLRDPARRTEPFDALKAIRLGPESTLTLGGNLRLRAEVYDAIDLGFNRAIDDGYLLTRAQLHADLRFNDNVRLFAQLGFGGVTGEERRLVPLQDNKVDLSQLFLEAGAPVGSGRVSLRAGRQEMLLGSGRLVNPRDGPNTRLTFDGARVTWNQPGMGRVDVFYTRPVQPRYDAFDDQSSKDFQFWGAYGTVPLPIGQQSSVDLYYLGIDRDQVAFAQGRGGERRHTFGVRFAGRNGAWDWDGEGAIQIGDSQFGDIRAYSFANDIGYTFSSLPLTPRLGLRFDLVSGDDRPGDGSAKNFEIPFPKLPYLIEASFISPTNIVDIHPSLKLNLSPTLRLTLDYLAVWKHRQADAFYLPPLRPVAGTAGIGKFIGHVFQMTTAWDVSSQVTLEATVARVELSSALRRAGGESSNFGVISTTMRF